MRTRLSILLVFVMVLTFVPLGPAGANGYWPISETTTLTEDYHGNIEIVADGVTLDCAGHNVVGSGTGNGIFVGNQTGIAIRNCHVSGFYAGILLADSSDNAISGNIVTANVGDGIWLTGDLTDRNAITGNAASGNGAVGISVDFGDDNILSDNEVTGNEIFGLNLMEASGNSLIRNVATGNGSEGILLWGASSSTLTDNQSRDNGNQGIIVGESAGTTLTGNVAENNTRNGILMYEADNSVIAGNTAIGNNEAGIRMSSSNHNAVTGNTVGGNRTGISLGRADWNDIEGNQVHDNVFGEHPVGIVLWDSSDNTISDNVATANGVVGIWLSGDATDGNSVVGNTVIGGEDWGITVESGDSNVLADNEVSGNAGGGIHLGEADSNFVTGNAVTGNAEAGIRLLSASNNTVTDNQSRSNGGQGFLVEGSSTGNSLTSNIAEGNGEAGFGIELSDSNILKGNTSADDSIGFLLTESHDNTIKNNTSEHPEYHGFSLWYSDGNKLMGNVAHSGAYSLGFVLVDSDSNSFKDNDAQGQADTCPPDPVEDCGGSGFHILGSSDNQFVGNNVDNYFIGFGASDGPWVDVFHGSHRNVFKNNVASQGRLGFNLTGTEDEPTHDNILVGNVATSFYHGFRLADASGNTLTDNTATHNSGDGFILKSSTGNTLKDNLARYNQYGFGLGNGSTDNWLIGNTSRQNDRFGFSAFGSSPGNLLKENKACQNGEYDIWSHATSAFELVDNKVCGDSFVGYALVVPGWDADGDATAAGQMIADAIADATGVDFRAVVVDSPRQMYDLMCALPGTAVGLMGSHYYAVASEDCGVDASFKAIRFGRDHYQSQFVVDEDNTAAGIADLDGLLWAYSSTYSVSGFLVPLGMMEIAGVAASAVLETDDHLAAITAVSLGEADFATTFVSPALPENVRVLVESPPIPNDPIAFGAEFPAELRSAVEAALIEVAATPAGGAAFRVLDRYMEGISPASDAEWDWLRTVLDAAGFGIDDLW